MSNSKSTGIPTYPTSPPKLQWTLTIVGIDTYRSPYKHRYQVSLLVVDISSVAILTV